MNTYIFDTETTGGDTPHLIEAAWLKISDIENLSIEEKYLQRFNPKKKSDLGALATHHILDEELAECPLHTSFSLPENTQYLIGHNVDYDWKVIGQPEVKRICTLAMTRFLFPALDNHSQGAVLYSIMGSEAKPLLRDAHSALQDVENCYRILSFLLKAIESKYSKKLTKWEDLWKFSEHSRIPVVMSFGKHKGQPIKDVPADYKRWLLNQPDIDPYLIKALQAA